MLHLIGAKDYWGSKTVSFTADACAWRAKGTLAAPLNKDNLRTGSRRQLPGRGTPPATNFAARISGRCPYGTKEGAVPEVILGTIAVDVSSDWTRFPRYGFVATFDASKTESKIQEEMAFLNRCHINGVQFKRFAQPQPLGS